MPSYLTIIPFIIASFTLLPSASALESSQTTRWDVGLAFTLKQSPFQEGETGLGIALRSLDSSGFNIPGPAIPLHKTSQYRLYIGAGLDEWDYTRDGITNMNELDKAVNIRFGGAIKVGSGVALAEIARDMADAHGSQQAKLRYTHNPFPYKNPLRPFAELQWLSADMTDYYVGVHPHETTLNRAAYSPDSGVAIKAGIDFEYPLTSDFTLTGNINMTHYGNAISDSPIIEKDNLWGSSLGVTYRWK